MEFASDSWNGEKNQDLDTHPVSWNRAKTVIHVMSGLNLIQSYLSESEDEIEDNHESEISAEPCPESKIEAKNRPGASKLPLPASILTWEGTKHHDEVTDDPSLHDGRIRSFKHERGNWATLVYIDYVGSEAIRTWVDEAADRLGSTEGLKSFSSLHLSLTKSLVLKFHWIDSFADGVRRLCQKTRRFLVDLSDLRVYCNEDKTRTFIGIRCEDGSKSLQALVAGLDKLLEEFQLPPFYEEASFHISVMWCLGDSEEKLNALLPSLTESLYRIYAEDLSHNCFRLDIQSVNCKIGNKMYTFSLL